MIKIEKTQVVGLEPTIRGMRNPMNSWGKSDSDWCTKQFDEICETCESHGNHCVDGFLVGAADEDLMLRLAKAGSVDEKFRRMIAVYVDLTAPLYWWKEFDAYKVGTVANSCSTMHKIHAKEFTLDDFSCEHLFNEPYHRDLITSAMVDEDITSRSKVWATPLDILKFTIEMLNAWREVCRWIEGLPYSEVITCNVAEKDKNNALTSAITKLKAELQWGDDQIAEFLLEQAMLFTGEKKVDVTHLFNPN